MNLKNKMKSNFYCELCLTESENPDSDLTKIRQNSKIEKIIKDIFCFEAADNLNSTINLICISCNDRVGDILKFIEFVQENRKKLDVILKTDHQTDITYQDNDHTVVKKEEIEIHDYDPMREIESQSSLDEKPFICDICTSHFSTVSALSEHIDLKHQSHLKDEFSDKFSDEIETEQQPEKSFSETESENVRNLFLKCLNCELCAPSLNFKTFEELKGHYQETHSIRGYVKCCKKQLYTKKAIMNHCEMHSNPADFMCGICKKLMPDKYTLKEHTARHSTDQERKYQCDLCKKKFALRKDVAIHIKCLHLKKDKVKQRVPCDECEKDFFNKTSMEEHKKRFHIDTEKHICEICGKVYRTKYDLSGHIRNSHVDIPKQECNVCGQYFKYIRKHMRTHIDPAQYLKCKLCGLQVKHNRALWAHMKIHSGLKPFQCTTCNAAFKRKTALNDHMSTHSGIPGHSCKYCGRTFNNSGNKSKHLKHCNQYQMSLNNEKT
uniref:CSON004194 protein n=1 Tax=Culicoides sonorensis TaxID=179676 RepID=A0A336MQB4_CULSO